MSLVISLGMTFTRSRDKDKWLALQAGFGDA